VREIRKRDRRSRGAISEPGYSSLDSIPQHGARPSPCSRISRPGCLEAQPGQGKDPPYLAERTFLQGNAASSATA